MVTKPLSSWEFVVGEYSSYLAGGVNLNELRKLSNLTITHNLYPEGIDVIITDGVITCPASLHGYNAEARGGKHI